jgi:hypothetical protein
VKQKSGKTFSRSEKVSSKETLFIPKMLKNLHTTFAVMADLAGLMTIQFKSVTYFTVLRQQPNG